MLGRLLRHSSHYAIGSLLVTLASVISFPIFTRTFSVAEYGALNLISSVLLLWTGVGKLGIQQSIVRFHAEVVGGKRALPESAYVVTVLFGMACTGLAATLGMALATLVIPPAWWENSEVAALILPVSVLVVIRVLDSGVSNLVRAQQRSLLYVSYTVCRKYIGLGIILVIMYYFIPQLRGFYLGTFFSEALALLILMAYLLKKHRAGLRKFSPETLRAMIAFGVPMIAFELSGIVLNLGDRYVIQTMMGGEALGKYAAAYNLCEYLQMMLMISFAQAIMPMYMRMWEEKGADETRAFVERALKIYIALGFAVLAGMSATGADILALLASEKYAQGAVIIPYVVAGMLINELIPILGAGIFLHKKNRLLIPCVMFCAALNIGLNIWLIPSLGIMAAAIATLICYIVLASLAWWIGASRFSVRFPYADFCKFAILAGVMYFVVTQIKISNILAELLLRMITGVVVYALLVIALDRDARAAMLMLKARYISKSAP
jgi:O-antigen/teichoic acid export membrane protein